jgi:PTS system nitrogen regulatory IIA component
VSLPERDEIRDFVQLIRDYGVRPDTLETLSEAIHRLGADGFAARVSAIFSDIERGDQLQALSRPVKLRDHLHPDLVGFDISPPNWEWLADDLITRAAAHSPEVDFTAARDALISGGETGAWFPGRGLAVPHVKVEHLGEPLIAVTRTRKGIGGPTPDGEPIRLVFCLFDSHQRTEFHLLLLAHIAAVCGPSSNRGLLFAAQSSRALLNAIIALDHDPFG